MGGTAYRPAGMVPRSMSIAPHITGMAGADAVEEPFALLVDGEDP